MMQRKGMQAEPIVIRDFALTKQANAIRDQEIRIGHLTMASRSVIERICLDHPDMNPAWLCLRVMAGREIAVENVLREQGVEALVVCSNPCKVQRRKRAIVIDAKPVLRGYVLVRCLVLPAAIMGLLSVDGVIEILGGPVEPYRATPEEIIRFKMMARDGKYDHTEDMKTRFTLGEKVQVTDGPFASFPGTVTAVDAEKFRADVEVMIFGRATPVNLDLAQIEKL